MRSLAEPDMGARSYCIVNRRLRGMRGNGGYRHPLEPGGLALVRAPPQAGRDAVVTTLNRTGAQSVARVACVALLAIIQWVTAGGRRPGCCPPFTSAARRHPVALGLAVAALVEIIGLFLCRRMSGDEGDELRSFSVRRLSVTVRLPPTAKCTSMPARRSSGAQRRRVRPSWLALTGHSLDRVWLSSAIWLSDLRRSAGLPAQ